MRSKLIFIEGLPGSGKTTIAKVLNGHLNMMGIENSLFLEDVQQHPADYDGVAYFRNEEYEDLLLRYVESNDILKKISEVINEGYLISYVRGWNRYCDKISKQLFRDIAKKDIYELPLELHIELITKKWEAFAEMAKRSEKISIFDCCFIQNPMTVSMIRYGSEEEVVFNYIKKLLNTVKELNPTLIYVNQMDIDKSFNRVKNERPKEWLSSFVDYYTNQGFGKSNNYSGIEGTIEVLKERAKVEKNIICNLQLEKKCYVDNSDYSLEEVNTRISDIVKECIIG